MATKNKLFAEACDQEKQEELRREEDKAQDDGVGALDEAWWDAMCYPDPHESNR